MRQNRENAHWNGCQDNAAMAAVLRDMCEGSSEAFDRFYSHYVPLVMRIACRLLGDRMEAEDVCHDIFLEAIRKGRQYSPDRGSVDAWMAVMTKSRCMDRMRKLSRTVVVHDAEEAERFQVEPGPEEKTLVSMERRAVRDALEELPEQQRNALVTAYYRHRTHRELAEEWEVPLGTVKSWIRYGIHNLRKSLTRRGWAAEGFGREEGGG
ncbi:sigma-70 family RNA polymerase sigma factor [Paenibacillus sp. PL2-23]|uniref:RNA polymerase sigma factor n=1 Tax=Paenibacillus sp. PL2-23 TaxID=2100729 RepID=UPI0030F8C9AB